MARRKKAEVAAAEAGEEGAVAQTEFQQLGATEARGVARAIGEILKTESKGRKDDHLIWCFHHQPRIQRAVQAKIKPDEEGDEPLDPTIFLQQLHAQLQADPKEGSVELLKVIKQVVNE